MAKAKVVKAKVVTQKDQELNRWCIEMAMRWPAYDERPYGAAGGVYSGGGSYSPNTRKDEDIIGRANKIVAWVKTSH